MESRLEPNCISIVPNSCASSELIVVHQHGWTLIENGLKYGSRGTQLNQNPKRAVKKIQQQRFANKSLLQDVFEKLS